MILKWVELRGPLSAVWKTAIAFPNQPNSKPTIPNQTTDGTGAYHLPDRAGARVFVIKPRGWRPPADGENLPRFHAKPGAGGAGAFPQIRSDEPDDLRALVVTDPQPASPAEVDYLSRGLVGRIGRGAGFAFGVTLGDIVYDRPD